MKYLALTTMSVFLVVAPLQAQVESLPAPTVHGNSFEILSNSRYSAHSGFTSSLPREVLSNVLWAMNRVPLLGSYRELYIATPQNVYLYDSVAHALVVHLAGNHRYNSGSAFEVGIACGREEEAGYAIEAGLLAGIAGWTSGSGNVLCCPMQYATNHANSNWQPLHPIRMVDVFGQGAATGLQTTVQARSTDSTLPDPRVVGPDTFEVLLAALHQDSIFDPSPLPAGAFSQLLWAGYGVTPHVPIGKRGLTIPSAVANYYLSRKVYLVRDTAVHRYHNRIPPGTSQSTSDHRLELVYAGDRLPALRAACPRIPSSAPLCIVVCVADTSLNWALQEAGFAGFQYLMQAHALGLQGCLVSPLGPGERSAIITALAIPGADQPVLVFACGAPSTAVAEPGVPMEGFVRVRTAPLNRPPVRIECSLVRAGTARLKIHDLAGRPVREFRLTARPAGRHNLDWDGTDAGGRSVSSGLYFCRLETAGAIHSARLLLVN